VISKENFQTVNGMCNSFWGWGKEDMALRRSLERKRIKIIEPGKSIGSNNTNTFWHIHNEKKRIRDKKDCIHAKNRYDTSCLGNLKLRDMKFKLESVQELSINGAHATLVNVKLGCNETVTPWCNSNCKR
jgi:hypothetical protein